jgi:glycosyltransferase involved in cell wall biosynthesis
MSAEPAEGRAPQSPPAAPRLAAIILTYDEQDQIVPCIASLAWADRVVVFDSFSRDETVARAEAAGAEVLQSPFQNYAQQRNAALQAVDSDWIFFVDADERATAELSQEIREVIGRRPEAGWNVPRHNYIFGRLTSGAGWFPDYQLRLFRRGAVRYGRPVHEVAVVAGRIGNLRQPLIHYNYRDAAQFHRKQRAYTESGARALHEQGIRPRLYSAFIQAWRQFWWRFVRLAGYRDGLHGLRLSLYLAYYEYRKFRRLAALWKVQPPVENLPAA